MRLLQELISTASLEFRVWLPSLAASLKMPVSGSGLIGSGRGLWVWSLIGLSWRNQKNLSEDEVSWDHPLCYRNFEGEEEETGSLLGSMNHTVPWPSDYMHQQNIGPQITIRTLLPNIASSCKEEQWKNCRNQGLMLSGECKASAPDIVMHPHLTHQTMVALSFHLNPKGVNLGPRIDSGFLSKNGVVGKLSNGTHHRAILGELSCSCSPSSFSTRPNLVTSSFNRNGFLGLLNLQGRREIRLVRKQNNLVYHLLAFVFNLMDA